MNEQKALATVADNFVPEGGFTKAERPVEEVSFFADRSQEGELNSQASLQGLLKGIRPLGVYSNGLRESLRQKISKNLLQDFELPELVEGLVEYILEVVEADPHQQEIMGLNR